MLNSASRQDTKNSGVSKSDFIGIDYFVQWGISEKKSISLMREFQKLFMRPVVYAEDGFIRSVDIGLSGEPGLSVILDSKTSYYNAEQASDLEDMLNSEVLLTVDQFNRTQKIIKKIIDVKISKYNHVPYKKIDVGSMGKRKILLIDQRFGDQSVLSGLADESTFKEMLEDALGSTDDCDILIKRHPDAIKGGKASYFNSQFLSSYEGNKNLFLIDYDTNPHSLFDLVDEVCVVSSGMGFEALICGKPVTCYGVPFYSGWGVTRDKKQISRRVRRRSVEEIFFFSYVFFSRYYSPNLRRRCEIEDVLDYISDILSSS
jgi:capsule polysaccharide export protein KpsC/LpsZ